VHFLFSSPTPIGEWALFQPEERSKLLIFLAAEGDSDYAGVPHEHRAAVVRVAAVFAMLGGAPYHEEKLAGAKRGAMPGYFLATAAWLRTGAGRA